MKTERCDFLVIGGGPAGCTAATLFKRYAPGSRVILLERAIFPRHHVGESLLPGMLPVLREMGAHDRIARAGFVRKVGVTFVWGKNRRPWDADFSELELELKTKGVDLGLETTWQVPRAEYDAHLLAHARECGVEVREGARAVAPLSRGEAVVGARVIGADGTAEVLRSGALADCSGQSGFLSKFRNVRRVRDDLKNVAAYGYFRGAPWKFRYTGVPGASRIFVCSAPEGWFWYIPIAEDLVSVGLVSKATDVRAREAGDMRAWFLGAIRRRPEISGLLRGRSLVRGMDRAAPQKDFFTASDWSYESATAAGPGWYAAGDAAFFIDPLLSSGVMMAHLSGRRCAYAALTERTGGRSLRAAVREDYGAYCREIGAGFLDLVRIWYDHEPSASKWFAAAGRRAGPRSPAPLSGKGSFVSLISGLNHQFARVAPCGSGALTNAPGHAWRFRSGDRETHVPILFQSGGGPASWREERRPAPDPERALRPLTVSGTRRISSEFVLVEGTGRLMRAARADFAPARGRGAFARRLVPSFYADVLKALDGRRCLAEAAILAAERRALPAALVAREALSLADDLAEAGVLSFGRPLRAPRARAWRGPLASLRRAEEALARGDARDAEAEAGRACRGPGRAWALAVRALAREASGLAEPAEADFEAALASAAANPRRGRGAPTADFDAAVERGWLEAAILDARIGFLERSGRADAARADGVRLKSLERDRAAARGVVAGAAA